jgi:hypothetical protein
MAPETFDAHESAEKGGSSGAVVARAAAPLPDIAWTATQMRAGARIVIDAELFAAFEAASSRHSLRALKSDLEAFDSWCRRTKQIALPATPELVAAYLDARAGQGAKPASLARYKASIAKIHQLLDLKDPTQAELVKLRLRAIRRAKGTAQDQARPLRFKGPVRDVEREAPRGINVRALLEACAEDLPGLRDRALLSVAYDTGLRASELVAIELAHIVEALDPEARLLMIARSKGDAEGEGRPPSCHRARCARSPPGPQRPGSAKGRCSAACRCGATARARRSQDAASRASPPAKPGICARPGPSPRCRRASNTMWGRGRCTRARSGRSGGR